MSTAPQSRKTSAAAWRVAVSRERKAARFVVRVVESSVQAQALLFANPSQECASALNEHNPLTPKEKPESTTLNYYTTHL